MREAWWCGCRAVVALGVWLALAGCSAGRGVDGVEPPSMGGAVLAHARRVDVSGPVAAGAVVRVALASGDVGLHGVEAGRVSLRVVLHESEPGDAVVAWGEQGLTVGSASGRPVEVVSVVGWVPNGPVDVRTGLGRVSLSGVGAGGEVRAESRQGALVVGACDARALVLSGAPGGVFVSDCEADRLFAESASGPVVVRDGVFDQATIRSATGAVQVFGTRAVDLAIETGTSEARVDGRGVGRLRFESGSGWLTLHAARPGVYEAWDGAR